MTKTVYYRTCDKLRTAFKALAAASATDPDPRGVDRIGRAMVALTRVPNALRVQVCGACNDAGYRTGGEPGDTVACDHPDVPVLDITEPLR